MADPTFLSPGAGDALQEQILNKAMIESIVGPIGSAAPLPFDTYFTKRLVYVKIPTGITIVSSGVTAPDAAGATALWSGTITPSVIGSVIRVRASSWLTTGNGDTNAVHLAILRDGVKVDHRVGMGVDSLDVVEDYATSSLIPIAYKITSLAGGGLANAKAFFTTVIVEELIPAASPSTTKAQLLELLADSIGDVMPKGSISQFVGQYPIGYTAVKSAAAPPAITSDRQKIPGSIMPYSITASNAPARIGFPQFVLAGTTIISVPANYTFDTVKYAYSSRASGGTLSMCSAVGVGQDFLVVGTTNAGAKVYRLSTNTWVNNITITTGQIQYGFPAVALSGNTVLYISGTGNAVTETDLLTGVSGTPVATPDASMIFALWERKDGKVVVIHGTTTSLRGSVYDPATKLMTQIGSSLTLAVAHSTTGMALIESEDRLLYITANCSTVYEWTDATGWIAYAVTSGSGNFGYGIQQGLAVRYGGVETLAVLHLASSPASVGLSRIDGESTYAAYGLMWSANASGDVVQMQPPQNAVSYPGKLVMAVGQSAYSERRGTGSANLSTMTMGTSYQAISTMGWMRDLSIMHKESGAAVLFCTKTGVDVGTVSSLTNFNFNNSSMLPSTNASKLRASTLKLSDEVSVVYPAICMEGIATLAGKVGYPVILVASHMRNLVTFYAAKD